MLIPTGWDQLSEVGLNLNKVSSTSTLFGVILPLRVPVMASCWKGVIIISDTFAIELPPSSKDSIVNFPSAVIVFVYSWCLEQSLIIPVQSSKGLSLSKVTSQDLELPVPHISKVHIFEVSVYACLSLILFSSSQVISISIVLLTSLCNNLSIIACCKSSGVN